MHHRSTGRQHPALRTRVARPRGRHAFMHAHVHACHACTQATLQAPGWLSWQPSSACSQNPGGVFQRHLHCTHIYHPPSMTLSKDYRANTTRLGYTSKQTRPLLVSLTITGIGAQRSSAHIITSAGTCRQEATMRSCLRVAVIGTSVLCICTICARLCICAGIVCVST